MTMATSNDALATIAGLKQRIEWLEESMGRLLLEKEQNPDGSKSGNGRDNCCVTFTDASPDLERQLTSGRGSNCCVQFRSTKIDAHRERRRRGQWVIACLFFAIMVFVLGRIYLTNAGSRNNSGANLTAQTSLKLD